MRCINLHVKTLIIENIAYAKICKTCIGQTNGKHHVTIFLQLKVVLEMFVTSECTKFKMTIIPIRVDQILPETVLFSYRIFFFLARNIFVRTYWKLIFRLRGALTYIKHDRRVQPSEVYK